METSPGKFLEAAKKVCSTPFEEVNSVFPLVDKKDAGYVCLDITYQYTLLSKGFGAPLFIVCFSCPGPLNSSFVLRFFVL